MKRLLITSIGLCLSIFAFAQEPVEFKLNPEVGKTLQLNMLMKTDVDGPQSVIMDMNMKMELLTAKKENENYSFENVIKAIKTDIDAGMMTLSYNSEEEATDETTKMLAAQFSKILDQKITSIVTEKGKTIEFDLPPALGAQGLDASSFSNMSPAFPDHAVAPGESWESSAEIPDNPIFSKIEMTSTFLEENADGYIITIKGKMLQETGEEIGTMSGTYSLDKQTHFTKNSTMKTSIETQGAKITSEVEMTVE